jgi:AcrR family transcriptional regulator
MEDSLSSEMTRMALMSPRKYDQRLRAEAAEHTRQSILDALEQRLREAPAERASVDDIAQMAGVARSTVYLIFGSRAGLFDGLGDHLIERAGFERLVEATHHADAREGMRGGIRVGAEMFAANRDVLRALWSMADLDEQAVGGAVRRMEDRRARGMTRLARELARQNYLRPGLTQKDAAHIAWLLTGFDAFDTLYSDRGLSLDKTAELLFEIADRTLCR